MIHYEKGDATAVQQGIIAHIVNDQGGWGAGFVTAISDRWPEPEARYREWKRFGSLYDGQLPFERGEVLFVQVTPWGPVPSLVVANMLAQRGIKERTVEGDLVDYAALGRCLRTVRDAAFVRRTEVHMPRIGCGLAGSTWERILPYVERVFGTGPVFCTVWDLP